MAKEEKTEAELEELIAQRIVVGGVYVSVRRDPLLGWRPMVITAPKRATQAQKLADAVAAELRKKYTLKNTVTGGEGAGGKDAKGDDSER